MPCAVINAPSVKVLIPLRDVSNGAIAEEYVGAGAFDEANRGIALCRKTSHDATVQSAEERRADAMPCPVSVAIALRCFPLAPPRLSIPFRLRANPACRIRECNHGFAISRTHVEQSFRTKLSGSPRRNRSLRCRCSLRRLLWSDWRPWSRHSNSWTCRPSLKNKWIG